MRDGIDQHLGLLASVVAVADAECVGDLVDEHAHLPVHRSSAVHDDLSGALLTPAIGWPSEGPQRYAVAKLARKPLKRLDQMGVAVTVERL